MKLKSVIIKSIFLVATGFTFSFTHKANVKALIGKWELRIIIINDDTVFFRNTPKYTIDHNFKLDKGWIKNREDSTTVFENANLAYKNSMQMRIDFISDSSFSMTKLRSGSGISPEEQDQGVYQLKEDTLIMINRSRSDYKTRFVVDLDNNIFYVKDGVPEHMVYFEYEKAPGK